MAVSANTRRIYSIVALAIIGALVVWLFLRFIVFSGVDTPANDLKTGDFIRLKNGATGKYMNLCSLNRQPGQFPIVAVTANGSSEDPTTVFEVLVTPVQGSSYGEKAVALRTVAGCDVRTCGFQNDPTRPPLDTSGILPIEPIVGPHVYLFMLPDTGVFPERDFPGNLAMAALAPNFGHAGTITDETILNTFPKYTK